MKEVIKIKLNNIDDFENHPFQVRNDESLKELTDSIRENGLLNPLVVRKKQNGKYEMLAGHRRKLALELNGITEADCYIKELDDNEATIYMVDSNIYRNKILPSEKAFAYKMKLEAIKHQGKRNSSTQIVQKLNSVELLAKVGGESREQVRRYIRLTYLIPELLEIVDDTVKYDKRIYLTMGLTTAVELSYLNKDEQKLLYNTIIYEDLIPSYAQAIRIRKLSQKDKLTLEKILDEKKGNQNDRISFNKEKIEAVLPKDLLKRDKRYIEQYVIEAIENFNYLNTIKKSDE